MAPRGAPSLGETPVTNATSSSDRPDDRDDELMTDVDDYLDESEDESEEDESEDDEDDEEDDDYDDEDSEAAGRVDDLASEEDDDSEVEDSEEGGEPNGRSRRETDADLFRQSEIAADYIEGLLDILDVDGDIDELVQNGRPMVEVVGARLNNLVGARGQTLEALQELTRLAVYRQTGEPSRLLLDVGGFRATRRKELIAVAKNAAEKVKLHGEAVRLEPMSAFERKCVHDVINAMAGVESESEGVEPSRRIIVRAV
jgi:spoIIIJ-associated protein